MASPSVSPTILPRKTAVETWTPEKVLEFSDHTDRNIKSSSLSETSPLSGPSSLPNPDTPLSHSFETTRSDSTGAILSTQRSWAPARLSVSTKSSSGSKVKLRTSLKLNTPIDPPEGGLSSTSSPPTSTNSSPRTSPAVSTTSAPSTSSPRETGSRTWVFYGKNKDTSKQRSSSEDSSDETSSENVPSAQIQSNSCSSSTTDAAPSSPVSFREPRNPVALDSPPVSRLEANCSVEVSAESTRPKVAIIVTGEATTSDSKETTSTTTVEISVQSTTEKKEEKVLLSEVGSVKINDATVGETTETSPLPVETSEPLPTADEENSKDDEMEQAADVASVPAKSSSEKCEKLGCPNISSHTTNEFQSETETIETETHSPIGNNSENTTTNIDSDFTLTPPLLSFTSIDPSKFESSSDAETLSLERAVRDLVANTPANTPRVFLLSEANPTEPSNSQASALESDNEDAMFRLDEQIEEKLTVKATPTGPEAPVVSSDSEDENEGAQLSLSPIKEDKLVISKVLQQRKASQPTPVELDQSRFKKRTSAYDYHNIEPLLINSEYRSNTKEPSGSEKSNEVLVCYGAILGLGFKLRPLFNNPHHRLNTALNRERSSAIYASQRPDITALRPVTPNSTETFIPGRRYHADVLLYAPMKQYSDYSFLETISTYVFPFGILIQSFPEKSEVRSIVLTESNGTKSYCYCLIRYEPVSEKLVELLNLKKGAFGLSTPWEEFYAPRCLCIISKWAFHRRFVLLLQSIDRFYSNKKIGGWLLAKVMALLHKVISQQDPVLVPLPADKHNSLLFSTRSFTLPRPDIDYGPLLRSLSAENIITVFTLLLNERPMVFLCSKLSNLTPVIEAIQSLLYPMQWPYIYVPLLPATLTLLFESPVPYCVGAHPDYLLETQPPRETAVINLDKDEVTLDESLIVPIPEKYKSHLMKCLRQYCIAKRRSETPPTPPPLLANVKRSDSGGINRSNDKLKVPMSETPPKSKEPASPKLITKGDTLDNLLKLNRSSRSLEESELVNDDLQMTFIQRFFVPLLRMYKYFIKVPNAPVPLSTARKSSSSFFNDEGFINSLNKNVQEFAEMLVLTQTFHYFVQDRLVNNRQEVFEDTASRTLQDKFAKYQKAVFDDRISMMYMRGDTKKHWKKRWFCVIEEDLTYADRVEDLENLENLLGSIPLVPGSTEIALKVHKKTDPSGFRWRIKTGTKKLVICSTSEEERNLWVGFLRAKLKIGKLLTTLKSNVTLTTEQLSEVRKYREEGSLSHLKSFQDMFFNKFSLDSKKGALWDMVDTSKADEDDVMGLDMSRLSQEAIDKWFTEQK
eukprot:TRINITY_DN923_c0_g3_i3.p1 TRINITY_DN923_c0_g3~~TRINITY_DN923_c0_g3_i3.p1  ORF type:complete len:1316 (+),score=263.40 TRINITY_DN923_c0_g3_i3:1226-5173(+)